MLILDENFRWLLEDTFASESLIWIYYLHFYFIECSLFLQPLWWKLSIWQFFYEH